ncbi:MAG: endonuclease domain-containing protein [Clostridia bacterium]|nr:endonuclease domain-containing protein [Clostridia bacterium]
MKNCYPHKNRQVARMLRNNSTPEEQKLWYEFLKNYPYRFKRQQPIGPYIVDFYCPRAKLVIEIDGRQHYTEEGREQDKERSQYLESQGLHVMRIKNRRIREAFKNICEEIDLFVSACIDPNEQ